MPSLEGQSIGKYRLIERRGVGGMAEVYKARHPKLERIVAVKILHSYLSEGRDFLERFEREARSIASLRHPHILQIYDFDVENDLYYMVMEYIGGGTLQDKMSALRDAGRYMPVGQVLSLLKEVAGALDYAHERGILHRDIKPSNILLDNAGNAFLSDFGIARMMSGSTQLTATGSMIGTPTYMSPEQGQGDPLTSASDIYSLGVILYQLLTSKVPFTSETTPLAVIHKHIHEPPPNPAALRPALPRETQQVLLKALAKDPTQRFRTAGEMVLALQKSLPGKIFRKLDSPPKQVSAASRETPTKPSSEEKVAFSDLPTEMVEPPQADSRSLPTALFEESTREVFTPQSTEVAKPTPASAEVTRLAEQVPPAQKTKPGLPLPLESTRNIWLMLLMGVLLFAGRFLVEMLARVTNLFDYLSIYAVVELISGALGIFFGFWHWLTLRLFGVRLKRPHTFLLLAVWFVAFLLRIPMISLLGFESASNWHLTYGVVGLLGGLGSALLISKNLPHFRTKQIVAWTGLFALYLYLGDTIADLSERLWLASNPILADPLRFALTDFLVGVFLAWTVSRLVRPELEDLTPDTRKMEGALLPLVIGWMAIRFVLQMITFAILGGAAFDIDDPAWRLSTILILVSNGLACGFVLWFILHRQHLAIPRYSFIIFPLAWMFAYPLGGLLPVLFNSGNMWFWAASLGLGAGLAGAFTAWILHEAVHGWNMRKVLQVGLGFGVGAFLGNLASSSALGGLDILATDVTYSFAYSLQSALTALLGGAILFSLLLGRQVKIRWSVVLLAAGGFGLGALLQDTLLSILPRTETTRWWIYFAYCLWGISLVAVTRDVKKILLYGLLGVLGLLAGRYLWVVIRRALETGGIVTVFYLMTSLMLGLFLALGRRWQLAVLLALIAILFEFTHAAFPYPTKENFFLYLVDMLHLAFLGAALGLAFSYFGVLPEKASPESGT